MPTPCTCEGTPCRKRPGDQATRSPAHESEPNGRHRAHRSPPGAGGPPTYSDDTFFFAPDLSPFDLPPFDEAYAMGLADDAFAPPARDQPCFLAREKVTDALPSYDDEAILSPSLDVWLDEDELIEILGPAQANYGGAGFP